MAYLSKESQARASKKHYEANKEKVKRRSYERNLSQRKRNKEYIARIKACSCCIDCGESNPIVLDFDHVNGVKLGNVSDISNGGYSIKTIQKEIDKCEVRCSNCHRIATYNRKLSIL